MTTYAIIGDGAAGTTAAFYLRRSDPNGRISVYSDEATPAYYRAALTNYLMGELRPEQLFAVPPNFYGDFRVERFLTRVTGVNTAGRLLRLSDGQEHPYDQLLIATGARARNPSFPGADLGGVMTMRTMQDARFVMDEVQSGRLKRAVIVGGGILGLELVAGLRALDVEVTYVIRGPRLMPTLLDQVASDLVLSRCRHFGVDIRTDEEVTGAEAGKDGYFRTATLAHSRSEVGGDLMVVAIGIDPNVEFLQGSGIKVNRGIPVDDGMRTNIEAVFAGGDVAEVNNPRLGRMMSLGLWEPARHHGRIAGINMAGGSAFWKLPVPYNATRLYDLDLAAIGESVEQDGDHTEIDFPQAGRSIVYRKLVFRNDRLVGALLLGHRKEHVRERGSQYRQLISSGVDVGHVRGSLLDPLFDLTSWMDSLRSEGVSAGEVPSARPRTDISRIIGRPPPTLGAPAVPASRSATGEPAHRSLSALMRSPVRAGTPEQPAARVQPGLSPTGSTVGASPALKMPDGAVLGLEAEHFTLGRSEGNDVVVDDPQASAQHAEIRRSGSQMLVGDLGSRNGTFVNENPVAMPRPLAHGDVIRIGDSQLTFINQVLPPRPNTGPVGLPDEPLHHPGGRATQARVSWGDNSIDLGSAPAKIGRDPAETAMTLDDKSVSWIHAELSWHDDHHYLRDLGSRNGTFVNGELIAIPRALRNGDVIHVGNTDLHYEAGAIGTIPFTPVVPEDSELESGPLGFVGTGGPELGIWFAVRDTTTIGRDEGCEIRVDDLTVSRRHATLHGAEGDLSVRDLGSTNGTWVNDERVPPHEARPMTPGDLLRVGRLELRLDRMPADATFAEPPPVETGPGPAQATSIMDASELLGRDLRAQDGAEPAAFPRLVVESGPLQGREFALSDLPITFGRADGPGITGLGDGYVSARHLQIRDSEKGLEAVDLHSSNGTWVDEVRLEPDVPRPIGPGSKLRLGPSSVLVVEN